MEIYKVTVYGGRTEWRQNGELHRIDGPAIEYANGAKFWYLHGKLHRTDGPAVEWANGDKFWYFHGKLHREDGPAVEYSNGKKEWWFNSKYYGTEQEWLKAQERSAPCEGKTVEIDGVKYKPVPQSEQQAGVKLSGPGGSPVSPVTDFSHHNGTMLRDHFAGQAITSAADVSATEDNRNSLASNAAWLAEVAYAIADAMLKRRETCQQQVEVEP